MAALDQTYGVRHAQISGVEWDAVELIAAVVGAKIHVLGFVLNTNTAVVIQLQSKVAGEDAVELTGANGLSCGAAGTIVAPYNPFGWFCTETGAALQIKGKNGTCASSGFLVYVVEPQ
jgi:hypothetical protein